MSAQAPATRPRRQDIAFRGWMPLALICVLIVAVGAYTARENDTFLSEYSLNGLLIATIPLALAAIGQTNALMVRVFDVSVGAQITVGVVVASYTIPDGSVWYRLAWGIVAVIAAGLGFGIVNIFLTAVLGLSSIIATLASLSILQGIALWLRPVPAGTIDWGFATALLKSVGFVPVAFIGVVVFAVVADLWLYRSRGGLTARAVGLDETAASRRGARVGFIFVRALLLSALTGAIASLFLAAQVQVGDPNVGFEFTLTSIAAAVIGGASLMGGRGSFIGAVLGALFLTELVNIVPFLGLDSSWSQMLVGALTLLAFIAYQAPELVGRIRASVSGFRSSLSGREVGEGRAPTG
jgi:ribose/xylose/arabinose/galactoside ABC-type transport system permease subunit